MKNYRLSLWSYFFVILILCCLDYQFFTEGLRAHLMAAYKRQTMHLLILGGITAAGYMAWFKHPLQWPKKLWRLAYVVAIALIGAIGLLQWQSHLFGPAFLDGIFGLRIFFCSPAPFFVVYLLTRINTSFAPVQH